MDLGIKNGYWHQKSESIRYRLLPIDLPEEWNPNLIQSLDLAVN